MPGQRCQVRRFRDAAYRPQAPTLSALRARIDALDAQIVELLAARALCVKDATRFKRSSFERYQRLLLANLLRFVRGETLLNVVDKRLGY